MGREINEWYVAYWQNDTNEPDKHELAFAKEAWQSAQPEWRPIDENTPLNEYVLLAIKYNATPLVGMLTGMDYKGGQCVELAKDGYTVSSGMYCGGAVAEEDWLVPTHWMPLPEAPKQ